jgi:hypothetical protein
LALAIDKKIIKILCGSATFVTVFKDKNATIISPSTVLLPDCRALDRVPTNPCP